MMMMNVFILYVLTVISILSTNNIIIHAKFIEELRLNLNNVRSTIINNNNNNDNYNDIFNEEEKMIDMLNHFISYHKQWKNDKYLDINDNDTYNNVNNSIIDIVNNIHIDVVLLGFPASAVDVIKDKWFDSLGREDDLLSYYKDKLGNDHILHSPGNVRIKYNFHLVRTSFHATDVVKERLEKMLRLQNEHDNINDNNNKMKTGPRYLNSWEVEELLDGISSSILSTTIESIKPSATLFILNLGSLGLDENVDYSYQNGFSSYDLKQLANDDEILDRAKLIITNEKRMTRIHLERNDNPKSIFSLNKVRDSLDERVIDTDILDNNNVVHWKDAITETKEWASKASKITKEMDFSLRERAIKILKAPKESLYYGYKQILSKLIVESNTKNQNTVVNPCTSSTWIGSTRMMWMDLNAKGRPPILSFDGVALNVPSPRKLSDLEWLKLGADSSVQNHGENIIAVRKAISRYLNSARTILSEIKCKVLRPQGSSLQESGANYIRHWTQYLNKALSSKIIQPSCGILQMKIALLEATLDTSDSLEKLMNKLKGDKELLDDGIDTKKVLKDVTQIHLDVLTSALEASNVLIDETIHPSRISEQATIFLSHLAGFILHTTRFIISPPMERTMSSMHKLLVSKKSIYENLMKAKRQYEATHTDLYQLVHNGLAATVNTLIQPQSLKNTERGIWSSSLPNLLFPANMDITLYVVRLQSSYEPISTMKAMLSSEGCNSGFDFWIFMQELSRLKLPNQQMTISMEEVDSTSEVSLGIALASCVRTQMENGRDQVSLEQRAYLDSKCIRAYLQHYDEQSLAKSARKSTDFVSETFHLPIFLISVDDPFPMFLDGASQAVNIGDSVIIIQNSQESLISGLKCGNDYILASGRNPIGPALAASAAAFGGLPYSHVGHCGQSTTSSLAELLVDDGYRKLWNVERKSPSKDLFDRSSFLGASPVFEAMTFSQPHFSLLDIDFIHRARVLHSIGISREISFSNIDAMIKFADGNDKQVQVDEINRIEDLINQIIADTLIALSSSNWASAASNANELYALVHRQAEEIQKLSIEDDTFINSMSERQKPESSRTWPLLFYPMISGFISFAVMYFLLKNKNRQNSKQKKEYKQGNFQKHIDKLLFNRKKELPS